MDPKSNVAILNASLGRQVVSPVLPPGSKMIPGHVVVEHAHTDIDGKIKGIAVRMCDVCKNIKPRNGWKNPCKGPPRLRP